MRDMRGDSRNLMCAFWALILVAFIGAVAVVFAAWVTRQSPPATSSTLAVTQQVTQQGVPQPTLTSLPLGTSPVATVATPNISVYQVGVDANRPWQDTDIVISLGDRVTIQYISGTWTGGLGAGQWYDGKGDMVARYKCAVEQPDPSGCKEPMPNVYNGTLIGKVGDNLVEIGDYLQFTSSKTGNLFLRMNDHDEGLFDNQGSITVQISVQQSG
jgi:hypothetical protein